MVLAESDFLRWRGCLCKGRGYSWVCSDVSGDRGDLGGEEDEEGGEVNSEKAIKLAAKMYEARDAVRILLGDRFKERMATGIENLEALAAAHNTTVMAAAQRSAKMYADEHNGMAALMIIAAAVEHAEPSE
jgi:hypothetical protein